MGIEETFGNTRKQLDPKTDLASQSGPSQTQEVQNARMEALEGGVLEALKNLVGNAVVETTHGKFPKIPKVLIRAVYERVANKTVGVFEEQVSQLKKLATAKLNKMLKTGEKVLGTNGQEISLDSIDPKKLEAIFSRLGTPAGVK